MSWRAMPFLRLLIPFALGIWAGKLAPAPWTVEACVCLGAVLPLLWLADRSRHGLARRAASWAIPFYLLLLGHLCQGVNEPRWKVDYFAAAAMRWDKAGGRVLESQAREDRYRVVLGIRAIGAGDEEWRRASGKLLLYLPKDFFPQAPRLGDTLWAQGRIAPIEAPLNPEAFDVSRFYAGRGIFHQMYVGVESVWWRPSERSAGLIAWVQARRVAGLETLRRRLPTLETFGVGAALTLGYRDELDVAVRDAYAASGVIHVLAVSGLHVGLVYLALGFFFQRAPRRMFWLGGLLQGMGVWAFVLIAGAPASAVRAGAMLSFFLFGRLLSRSGQPFNTMAAAAFCSLCFCPRWLFEPGFQLSYAAVAGIVAWQSDIYRWVVFRWAPLDYLWKLTSVGLAAQLATFPLSAYYFHQFPVYFWLSGLVAAPAAMLLLGAGLALLLLDGVVWLGPLIGKLLFWALSAFNAFVFWIESLPFSRLAGIWLPASAVACCYTGFILATIGLRRRNTSLILLALSLLSILSLRYAWSSWQAHQQRQAVFYTIRGHTLVDFFQGRRRFSFSDLPEEERRVEYAAQRYRWSRGVKDGLAFELDEAMRSVSAGPLYFSRGLGQWANLRVAFVGPAFPPEASLPPQWDIALIYGDTRAAPERLFSRGRPRLVLIDASNRNFTRNQWRRYCHDNELSCHDLTEQGALIIDVDAGVRFRAGSKRQ